MMQFGTSCHKSEQFNLIKSSQYRMLIDIGDGSVSDGIPYY